MMIITELAHTCNFGKFFDICCHFKQVVVKGTLIVTHLWICLLFLHWQFGQNFYFTVVFIQSAVQMYTPLH